MNISIMLISGYMNADKLMESRGCLFHLFQLDHVSAFCF